MSADAEVLAVLARERGPGAVPFVAGVLSWPEFTSDERAKAWDRLADAIGGTAAEIRAATDYLVHGPAS